MPNKTSDKINMVITGATNHIRHGTIQAYMSSSDSQHLYPELDYYIKKVEINNKACLLTIFSFNCNYLQSSIYLKKANCIIYLVNENQNINSIERDIKKIPLFPINIETKEYPFIILLIPKVKETELNSKQIDKLKSSLLTEFIKIESVFYISTKFCSEEITNIFNYALILTDNTKTNTLSDNNSTITITEKSQQITLRSSESNKNYFFQLVDKAITTARETAKNFKTSTLKNN